MYTDDTLMDSSPPPPDDHDLAAEPSGATDDSGVGIAPDIDHNFGLEPGPDTDPGTGTDTVDHPDASAPTGHDPGTGSGDASGREDQTDSTDATAADHTPAAGGDADGDLTISGGSGTVDLGAPNLSYDGGEPNAVAVEAADGSVEAYLDADHNGTVDQVVRIEPDGTFAVWGSDGQGWSVVATGHLDASGNAVLDQEINPEVAATEPSALSQAGATDPGVTEADPAGDTGDPAETYAGVASGDLAVATSHDQYLDAGPAQYDLNGDGTPETAVLHDGDRFIQVSDTDGDGRADEMLQVDSSTHQAAILTDDGSGHWQVTATGYVDASGDFVSAATGSGPGTEDVDARSVEPATASMAGVAGAAEGAPAATFSFSTAVSALNTAGGQAVTGADMTIGDQTQPGTDPPAVFGADTGAEGASGADEAGTAVGQHTETLDPQPDSSASPDSSPTDSVMVDVNGQEFDAGPPTVDSDGDGRPDTVEIPGPNDTTLHYQDSNGDGVADKAWATDASGQVTASYQLGPDGQWAGVGAGQAGDVESV